METVTVESAGYRPGECNLGTAERRRRVIGGWVGLGSTALLWAALARLDAGPWTRLTVFFPAFIAAVGFVQAWNRFCVGFGMAGLYNFGPAGERHVVDAETDRALDRAKARRLMGLSLGIAAAFAIAAALS